MNRKRLKVARKGGPIVKAIKKALKREGKTLTGWHGDQEAAGKINLTLRTLQKWMRVATKWPAIEAKATSKGLDPDELGLEEALALAVKHRRTRGGRADLDESRTRAGSGAKHKLKITCAVSCEVRSDLTRDQWGTLFNRGGAVLGVKITITDSAGRVLARGLDAQAAPEVVMEECWE
jgi:hypothetical protein